MKKTKSKLVTNLCKSLLAVVAIAALILSGVARAQDVNPPKEAYDAPKKDYSPFVGDHFPTRV
ncbi:MAG: hypothetical protein IH796_03940, partial [Deltaproteobacteria bacterium]|nr:hypothetical protein [Deltaproteobacteria bacterium]